MSQWSVEIVVGKLLTDEEFRRRCERRMRECLAELCQQGLDLTDVEIAALVETDPRSWTAMAEKVDDRLRSRTPRPVGHRSGRPLTPREQLVLRGVFEGLTNKQIGSGVGISEGAVKATLQHLFHKTHVRTRAQLVRAAIEGSFGPRQTDR